ncbi:MAG: hypothetical protein KAR38_09505 [Calditrichia bacterium]|nr:hypothetical protein [Calditrichia bacterium]
MGLFQILVCTGLVMALLFLLTGFFFFIFGKKRRSNDDKSEQIDFSCWAFSVSIPYRLNIALCLIGLIILFLTFNLYTKSGEDQSANFPSFHLFQTAYAELLLPQPADSTGWVYFGDEKNENTWNFTFVNGNISDLLNRTGQLILRSKKEINLREKQFSNLNGTILQFMTTEPKIIGKLPANSCVLVEEIKSVGFGKLWLRIIRHDCPGN